MFFGLRLQICRYGSVDENIGFDVKMPKQRSIWNAAFQKIVFNLKSILPNFIFFIKADFSCSRY